MYPVAILAGGMATRLLPITQDIPKSLIDFKGKPFIHWQLKLLSESGCKSINLCLGMKGELIQNYVGDGSQYGLSVTYSHDGDSPLGTGGAIIKALPNLGECFGVLYGDSYLPINYEELFSYFKKSKKSSLMTVFKNQNRYDQSNVKFEAGAVAEYSKIISNESMQHIDYGFSIFNREVFSAYVSGGSIDLAEIISSLVSSQNIAGYEVLQRFYEIGSFRGIEDFKKYLEDNFNVIHN